MNKFAGNQTGSAANSGRSSSRLPRIGELLVAAKIIKPEVLNESLQIAKTSKTLIGRTLVTLGQLDEKKLQSALELQTLIRKGAVSSQFGIKALILAASSESSIEEALFKLGWQPKHKKSDEVTEDGTEGESDENQLATLMLDSGLVNKQVMANMEQQSKENNLPLGRCLVVNRHLTQHRLQAVLSAQSLVRDSQITKDQAVAAIQTSLKKRQPIEHSLMEFSLRTLRESDIRLGDLLTMAGCLNEVAKLTALEIALTDDTSLSTVLVETGVTPADVIEKASILQRHVFSGLISLNQAGDMLKRSQVEKKPIEQLIAESQSKGPTVNQVEQLVTLFLASGFLTADDIAQANQTAEKEGLRFGEVILSRHPIIQTHIEAAWQAQRMIDDRTIKLEGAWMALQKLLDPTKDFDKLAKEALQSAYDDDAAIQPPEPQGWFNKLISKIFKK